MKILIISNSNMGLIRFRKELIISLIKEHEVTIVSPFDSHTEDIQSLKVNYHSIEIDRRGKNPLKDYKLYKNYKKIMDEVKPNVVLTYTIKPNIYGGLAAKRLRIPYIANITGLGTAVENRGLLQKITTFLYRKSLKKVNTVFFQNKENMEYFIKNKISSNNVLIPGSGVNLNEFNLLPYPSDNLIRFIFISRIMKEKGIDYYLEAAKFFKSKYDNLEFHICGFCEEDYIEELEKLQKENIIIYHGLVDSIKDVYKYIHCTIHPTYYPEGMSNVLLESSATGRPVITTNRSGTREIVEDGITGYLVDVKNQEQLNESIQKFIDLDNKKREKMGLEARKKIEKEFDRNIVVNKYVEVINNINKGNVK